MHPTLEALIALDEGASSPDITVHLRTCADCRRALAELKAICVELKAQPQFTPPSGTWERVVARTARKTILRPRYAAGLALAASMVLAVAIGIVYRHKTPGSHPAVGADASVSRLIVQSQYLEHALDSAASLHADGPGLQPAVQVLQRRVADIDYALAAVSQDTPAAQLRHLWELRVTVLRTLLEVRQVQAARPEA
jgi:hypothetical protein